MSANVDILYVCFRQNIVITPLEFVTVPLNMSQAISIDICQQRDINESEVENSVHIIERRNREIQYQIKVLQSEVDSLTCENVVLDKQNTCTEFICQKLNTEISELKTKTEDAAICLESTKWKFYKTTMLKEFENQTHKDVGVQKFKYEQIVNHKTHIDNSDEAPIKNNDNNKINLRRKIEELKQEIEKRRKAKQIEKDSLRMDIQILENRNSALTLRYQRQVQELESRYRQARIELNSLEKLLLEKQTLYTSVEEEH